MAKMLGYLKRIARVDASHKSSDDKGKTHHVTREAEHTDAPIDETTKVPRITFMEANRDSPSQSLVSMSYHNWGETYHHSMHRALSDVMSADEAGGHDDEDYEMEPVSSTEHLKRRRRHLLPPTSLNRARTNSSSSRSSGFKSASGDEGTMATAISSSSNIGSTSTFSNNSRPNSGNIKSTRKTKSANSRNLPDCSPTKLCATIASALWKPLWPPGWHPRNSSNASNSASGLSSNVPSTVADSIRESRECGAGGGGGAAHKQSVSMGKCHAQLYAHPQSLAQLNTMTSESSASSTAHPPSQRKTGNLKQSQYQSSPTHQHFHQQSNRLNGGEQASSSTPVNMSTSFEIFSKEDYEKVEDWLDEHPSFVHSYFIRKASRTLIDSWMLAHASSLSTSGTVHANPALASTENSGANTPVRKISAHEFEASGGGYLRPMVSTTCDGTPTFLQLNESENENIVAMSSGGSPTAKTCKLNLSAPLVLSSTSQLTQSQSFTTGDVAKTTASEEQNKTYSTSVGSFELRLQQPASNVTSSALSLVSMQQPTAMMRHRASIMSIKSREELKAITDEKELIFELLKDICNDLDVRSLCHKILKNVSILTHADRCSLFLVKGERNDPNNTRYLVSQLFDVSGQSTIEQMANKEEITIPWGTGIIGYVADSGEAVNIPDCYKDARFSSMIDEKTGYTTHNMLCNPIFDCNGEVMGVAQVINKNNAACFTPNDQHVFAQYLQFCGIGIRNAQLYERSQLENKRNQVLLDLARMVFEKQSNIENIIYRILIHILSLLQCERAQILLLADEPNDADFYYYGRTYQDPYVYFNLVPSSQVEAVAGESSSNASIASVDSTNSSLPAGELIAVETTTTCVSPKAGNVISVGSFSRVFDMEATDLSRSDLRTPQTPFEGRFPVNIGVTGFVATTGETLNIPDAYHDQRFDPLVDANATTGFRHRSILCMPIRNATRRIIGVAQLVNKLNGRPFNKNDENLFEAFAIFSGMGIENTQMFEKAVKAMAKQKVTLELLSYHASASASEATRFAKKYIPSAGTFNLGSLCFDDFSLNEEEMLTACIRMFIDLDFIERFQIDYKVLCKWILSVKKNYRPVLYHNWRHAFNVAQMMYAIFVNTDICMKLGELDTLALIVACLCHDLDHRGTNNSYHVKTGSPLAQLYSTSTLEHHHFDQSLMILNSEGNQILHNLSPGEYRAVVNVMEEAILSTDLAVYFQKRSSFFDLVDANEYDWKDNREHRSLLRSMLMTCCDIAAITKPWDIQKVVAELVASEFFKQGDIEREQLNIEPIDMMNRNKKEELPKMQISFIDTICMPIYESFAKLCPQKLDVLLQGVYRNRDAWSLLTNEPYELSFVLPIANASSFQVDTTDEATETITIQDEDDDDSRSNMNVEDIE